MGGRGGGREGGREGGGGAHPVGVLELVPADAPDEGEQPLAVLRRRRKTGSVCGGGMLRHRAHARGAGGAQRGGRARACGAGCIGNDALSAVPKVAQAFLCMLHSGGTTTSREAVKVSALPAGTSKLCVARPRACGGTLRVRAGRVGRRGAAAGVGWPEQRSGREARRGAELADLDRRAERRRDDVHAPAVLHEVVGVVLAAAAVPEGVVEAEEVELL